MIDDAVAFSKLLQNKKQQQQSQKPGIHECIPSGDN
jgi:hypothetical protein